MKIEELFEKAEKFFGMNKDERIINADKKESLILSLDEKIESMKDDIKQSENEEKDNLKKELEVLQKLREKIVSEEEDI